MRIGLAVLMVLHGTAHLVGFLTPWRLIAPDGAIYRTTILAGRVDLGSGGIRVFGVLWLLTAVAFWLASFAAFTDRGWWMSAALATAMVSLVLSLTALPDSRIGVPINVAIIGALLMVQRFGPGSHGWRSLLRSPRRINRLLRSQLSPCVVDPLTDDPLYTRQTLRAGLGTFDEPTQRHGHPDRNAHSGSRRERSMLNAHRFYPGVSAASLETGAESRGRCGRRTHCASCARCSASSSSCMASRTHRPG